MYLDDTVNSALLNTQVTEKNRTDEPVRLYDYIMQTTECELFEFGFVKKEGMRIQLSRLEQSIDVETVLNEPEIADIFVRPKWATDEWIERRIYSEIR